MTLEETMSRSKQFERDGYMVIPGLLSVEEANFYRAEIQKLSGIGDADCGKSASSVPTESPRTANSGR